MNDSSRKDKGVLRRLADRKRTRLAADSASSFRKFAVKMSIIVASFLLDGLVIPSMFQSLGLLTREFWLPIGFTFLLAIALEIEFISRIK